MSNKLYKIFIIAINLSLFCLAGCGKKSEEEIELADFSIIISDFTDYIKSANEQLNSLDPERSESVDEMLGILDEMDTKFADLAENEVPEQYQAVHELAVAASENMSQSVSYYHLAFEPEEFNAQNADVAYEYYTRAMMDVEYMGYILSGDEIPENDRIKIYEESKDSHILDKWLSGDDDKDSQTDNDNENE